MKRRIDLHGRVANDVTIDRSLARNPFINPAWSSLVHSTTDVDIASTLIATVMIDRAAQESKLSWRHVSFPHRPRSVKSIHRRMTWFLCIFSNLCSLLFLFRPLLPWLFFQSLICIIFVCCVPIVVDSFADSIKRNFWWVMLVLMFIQAVYP